MALPELDGALEPIVFAGRDSNTGKSHSLPDRIDTLCNRAINWAKCAARWAASLFLKQALGQNWRGRPDALIKSVDKMAGLASGESPAALREWG